MSTKKKAPGPAPESDFYPILAASSFAIVFAIGGAWWISGVDRRDRERAGARAIDAIRSVTGMSRPDADALYRRLQGQDVQIVATKDLDQRWAKEGNLITTSDRLKDVPASAQERANLDKLLASPLVKVYSA